MSGVENDPTKSAIIARVNPDNNLPTSQTYRQPDLPKGAQGLSSTTTAVNDANFHLSEPKK
jgi:hypothetical protein